MTPYFRVAVTRDFLDSNGTIDPAAMGLDLLDQADGVEWTVLSENLPEVAPQQLAGFDALLLLTRPVTAKSLEEAPNLAIVARFGVGYDNVNVAACTANGTVLTISPDGVRRPVAVSALTLMLTLGHKVIVKDRLVREGRWEDRNLYPGMGMTGRTLGVVGLGNIGRDIFAVCRPLGMKHIAFDPYITQETLGESDIELAGLEELLRRSDFVVLCCALTPETRGLINATRLGYMKPSAYLINVARGPVVDQQALVDVLAERRIQGAALDVFENEPLDANDRLCTLDNVILTPHAICWTDELLRGNGRSACQSILEIAAGRVPANVVNRGTVDDPRFQAKLARYRRSLESS